MSVDIGSSSVTGLRRAAYLAVDPNEPGLLAHPALATVPLRPGQAARLDSDFQRTGFLFAPPERRDGGFTDAYGVQWLLADGMPAVFGHPLESSAPSAMAAHPRPAWPARFQQPTGRQMVVLDAPCAGLLETCFALRGSWQFMLDLTENWRAANALLDWALETIVSAYEAAAAQLTVTPALMLYGDDLGHSSGMFLSAVDFRQFVRPRLRTLLSRLRRLVGSPILFHSCGAIRPIVPDLAGLEVEALNLDPLARGMFIPELRLDLPSELVLHGAVDFAALGRSLKAADWKSMAVLVCELAKCAPVICAPIDNIRDADELAECVTAAAFVHSLNEDDWHRLRRLGPVKSILEHGLRAAQRVTEYAGMPDASLPAPAAYATA